MGQFLGASIFLFFLAITPWFFPENLPGELPLPAFLLVGIVLVLNYLPQKRFYFFVLLLAALYDLVVGSSPQYLVSFALCALVPLFWKDEDHVWWFLLLQVSAALSLQEILFFLFSLRYGFVGTSVLIANYIPYLMTSLLLVLLLRPVIVFILGLLHYQQFEYHDEVMKGKLG